MVVKLNHEQLSALRRIDSPTISNAIEEGLLSSEELRPFCAGRIISRSGESESFRFFSHM